MFYSTDAGREGVRRVGTARNAEFFHSFVASKARKVSVQKRELRRIGCSRCRQKFAPCCGARAIWKSKSLIKIEGFGRFLKLNSAKFAPRCGARAIRKSKLLKHVRLGALLEVQLRKICATLWRESDLEVKSVKAPGARFKLCFGWQAQGFWHVTEYVAGAGVREGCKNVGMPAGFEEGFRALSCRCLRLPTLNLWKGFKFHVTEVLLSRDHFAWQLREPVCRGATFPWQAQCF